MKTKPFFIRQLPATLHKELKVKAAELGVSMQQLGIDALKEFLKK